MAEALKKNKNPIRKTITFDEKIYKLMKRVSEEKKTSIGLFLQELFIDNVDKFINIGSEKKPIEEISDEEQAELEDMLKDIDFERRSSGMRFELDTESGKYKRVK